MGDVRAGVSAPEALLPVARGCALARYPWNPPLSIPCPGRGTCERAFARIYQPRAGYMITPGDIWLIVDNDPLRRPGGFWFLRGRH
jgi:hypothetical protein